MVPGTLASFEPVIHALAGKLILGQDILPGADRPPTIFLASFINIFLFYFLIVAVPWRLELGACGLGLVAYIFYNLNQGRRHNNLASIWNRKTSHSCAHRQGSGPDGHV